MESIKDKRGNPFLIPGIIQHLTSPEIIPESNDKSTLRNLRQLSKLQHQILNPKYFDQVQMNIIINKSKNKILYCPSPLKYVPAPVHLELTNDMKSLQPKTWDPSTLAPTVRRLILIGNRLDYLLSSKSTRSQLVAGFIPLELISQISPHVTTLKLELEDKHIFQTNSNFQLLDFFQQFVNLEKLKLQTGQKWTTSDLDQFETFLQKIDGISKEFEIELVFNSGFTTNATFLEIMLSPERKFIIKNHKFSFNILDNSPLFRSEVGEWARILTMAKNNSIPIKNFGVQINALGLDMFSEEVRNQMMNDLSIISPYVEKLSTWFSFKEMDNSLFISCNWPRLKEVKINSPTLQLLGFSSTCPNLKELNLTIVESKSIFTNAKLTDEENLKQIFGDCTLKILRFKQEGQYVDEQPDEIPKIVPGSKLLQYLQDLLPNTLVEAEEFYPASEEDLDSW